MKENFAESFVRNCKIIHDDIIDLFSQFTNCAYALVLTGTCVLLKCDFFCRNLYRIFEEACTSRSRSFVRQFKYYSSRQKFLLPDFLAERWKSACKILRDLPYFSRAFVLQRDHLHGGLNGLMAGHGLLQVYC